MEIKLTPDLSKEEVFNNIHQQLSTLNLHPVDVNQNKPWGGYFVLDEAEAPLFIQHFFPQYTVADLMKGNKLSPKILVVAPQKRLSWQYHFRRAEIWKLIGGSAGVARSFTDDENPPKALTNGETIELAQGERHRLVGLDNWGIISEIWQHTDINNPSNEEDIVRVQDDFGR